jgi:hypothetical protein
VWDGGHLGKRTRLQGGPGKPLAHPDVPGRPGKAPGTWVSWDVPRASPGLPGLSGRPRSSPGFPWGFSLVSGRPRDFSRPPRAARTSEGLPRAPWDVRMSQGGSPGLLGVSYACPEVSQTGMTDPIPPVSEAAAVPAHQRYVSVSVLWFETFVAVPPSVVHNGLFGVRELCVLFFILFATEPFRLVKHLPNTHIQNPPLPSNT